MQRFIGKIRNTFLLQTKPVTKASMLRTDINKRIDMANIDNCHTGYISKISTYTLQDESLSEANKRIFTQKLLMKSSPYL